MKLNVRSSGNLFLGRCELLCCVLFETRNMKTVVALSCQEHVHVVSLFIALSDWLATVGTLVRSCLAVNVHLFFFNFKRIRYLWLLA
jgi:hypothetical protein